MSDGAAPPNNVRTGLWWRWLIVVTAGVALGGLAMAAAPGPTRAAFGLLVYASPSAIDRFGPEAVHYIDVTHGVLGAVMAGWGVAMLLVLFGPFRRGSREAWWAIAAPVAVWFVADTAMSLAHGVWQNAVLNTAVAVLYAVPLAATRRAGREPAG